MQPRGPLGALGGCLPLWILAAAALAAADDVIMSNGVGLTDEDNAGAPLRGPGPSRMRPVSGFMSSAVSGEETDGLYGPGPRRKKPFCNAFTGCGKKRSVYSKRADDSLMSSLVDVSSEPAVTDLNRQIMSEAKILEAIQEARDEIIRQHEKAVRAGHTPYRTRRSVDPSDFDRRFAADGAGRLRFY